MTTPVPHRLGVPMHLRADRVLPIPRRRGNEDQRLRPAARRRHQGVVELPIRPDVELVDDRPVEVQPVRRAGLGGDHAVARAQRRHPQLPPVAHRHRPERRTPRHHRRRGVEDDRRLVGAPGRADDVGPALPVGVGQVQRQRRARASTSPASAGSSGSTSDIAAACPCSCVLKRGRTIVFDLPRGQDERGSRRRPFHVDEMRPAEILEPLRGRRARERRQRRRRRRPLRPGADVGDGAIGTQARHVRSASFVVVVRRAGHSHSSTPTPSVRERGRFAMSPALLAAPGSALISSGRRESNRLLT